MGQIYPYVLFGFGVDCCYNDVLISLQCVGASQSCPAVFGRYFIICCRLVLEHTILTKMFFVSGFFLKH